eukprot:PhF_6_TR7006/c0_g1_i1/m.10408/K20182/VPS33; vacuolar protein sorting-associated protein 33
MSNLVREVIKLSGVREATKREFYNIIDGTVKDRSDKSKVIVLDPSLVDPLKNSGIVDAAQLKDKGVTNLFVIGPEAAAAADSTVIYFVRNNLAILDDLCTSLQAVLNAAQGKKNIHVYFVPRRTLAVKYALETLFGDLKSAEITEGDFDFDLIPFEDDVMSMELDSAYSEMMVEGDPTALMYVARALWKLQIAHFGLIPHIRAKGRHASQVARMIKRMGQEFGSDAQQMSPEIDTVIILDREVDLVTPMVTQLTYEGIIDEFFGIRTGTVNPAGVLDSEGNQLRATQLNNNDAIFAELRDLNFSAVGQALNARSIAIKNVYDKRKENMGLAELKDFMKRLPEVQQQHKLAVMHTNIVTTLRKETVKAEFHRRLEIEQNIINGDNEKDVIEYIEDCISRKDPLRKVLRLLCMLSLCSGSWKTKLYDQFRESLCQTYGIPQVTLLLHYLEKCGLFRRQETKSPFPNLRKNFNLFVHEVEEVLRDNLAYAYSGYAPLTARIVELATKSRNGWKAAENLLNQIPGDTFPPPSNPMEGEQGGEVPGNTRVILVVVIGGITFAEIAALRFLGSQMGDEGIQTRFVIATTKIINGGTFIDSVSPPGVNLS